MPKHDKLILDVNAVRANQDHFRHWKTWFHDYCLLEGYRNPAKDRLTHTSDHYIEAKRPFELAVVRSAIPSSEWNTLDDVITSKIPAHDADKPWVWLQKIKEHYIGASTLMQDRYYFWVQMAQADQTSISAWETALRIAAGHCSFSPNADEFMRDKFLFGLNDSFCWFREDIFYRDGQCKAEDPPFTLAFVVTQAVSFEAAQQTQAQAQGSRVGVVVRALAFHQCVQGSIPGPGIICGLSLLVLYSAPRGFSPGTPVFPSPQKPTFDLIWFIWFTVSPISTALVLG